MTPFALPVLKFEPGTPPLVRLLTILLYPLRHLAEKWSVKLNAEGARTASTNLGQIHEQLSKSYDSFLGLKIDGLHNAFAEKIEEELAEAGETGGGNSVFALLLASTGCKALSKDSIALSRTTSESSVTPARSPGHVCYQSP